MDGGRGEEGRKKGRSVEKKRGWGGCVTRTCYAAVIWSEYKTDEREQSRVQFTHLHAVFAFRNV